MKIYMADSYRSMSRKAANILSAQIILHPRSVIGLATGTSPLGIYSQLIDWFAKGDLDFSEVATFNLDEYVGLPPDHPQSYHRFMEDHFFGRINIDRTRTFLPDGTNPDIPGECARYNEVIRHLGGVDIQLLGIGQNGHIGFNEPGTSFAKNTHYVELSASTRLANARFFASPDDVPRFAFTVGMKTIMQARKILLVASGPGKAAILQEALTGPVTPQVPASILQLHPDFTVVADREALAGLLAADAPLPEGGSFIL